MLRELEFLNRYIYLLKLKEDHEENRKKDKDEAFLLKVELDKIARG